MLYLRNSIPYDHDFGYTGVKWWYLQAYFYFYFFDIFIFRAVTRVKGQKMAQDDKKFCLLHSMSQEPYSYDCHLYGTLVENDDISWYFVHFQILILWVFDKMTKNSVSLLISETASHVIVFLVHMCKMMISPAFFFFFLFSFFQNSDFSGFSKFINRCQMEILKFAQPSHACDIFLKECF